MYFSLKKLTPLMLFFHDFFIGRKKLSFITILSIFLIVGGSLLVTTDSFSKDYLGYGIVLISNILTITYSKLTEIYHKVVGFSNLRLLIYNNYLTLPILFIGVIVTEEYTRLYKYFTVEDNGSEGNFLSLGIYLFLYGFVCSILTSSFFISNEKNSSLITKLLSTSRGIFVSLFLYLFDKKKNNLNLTMFIGLVLAIIGSILINIESLFKNIHTTVEKTGEEKAEGKGEDKEEEEVKVKGDDKDTKNNKEEKEDKKDSKYKINDEEVMIINIKKLNKS
jgi:drug/metabolite transporter (DMT)-like permease